jgi:hypothetical protein
MDSEGFCHCLLIVIIGRPMLNSEQTVSAINVYI